MKRQPSPVETKRFPVNTVGQELGNDTKNEMAGANEQEGSILRRLGGSSIGLGQGVSAVALGALGYFLGWRYLLSYYSGFGIDPAFLSFSPVQMISAGWRIYTWSAVVVVIALCVYVLIQQWAHYMLERNRSSPLLCILVLLLVTGSVIVCYWFYRKRQEAVEYTFAFYAWVLAGLMCLFIAYVLGKELDAAKKSITLLSPTWLLTTYRVVFAWPSFWLTVLVVSAVLLSALGSSWLGYTYSIIDHGVGSRLPLATFYTSEQLDIPKGQVFRDKTWLYDNLRLLGKVDETYFVFRTDEVIDHVPTVYAIPEREVLQYRLQPFYGKASRP